MDVEQIHTALLKLLALEKDWIPGKPGTSLYIRPFVVANEPQLGVKVADSYKLLIILSPVGAYYKTGFNPVSIKVEDKYVRATKGGLGEAKTPANYAMSLAAQQEAYAEGFGQVLWLDAVHRKYIEEVGTMNILFKINGEIITPALNGSILGGITRKTVLELCRSWGMKVYERQISIEEVFEAHGRVDVCLTAYTPHRSVRAQLRHTAPHTIFYRVAMISHRYSHKFWARVKGCVSERD
ncbi:Branched-chain-amino-acid aminotransferase 2 [Pelotomaculum schinkii]|uniref:Branched-chain-amino-acid aminotransferase 2 n=1 Tax=Pelotomaculum schinkii TaxID=78350 RepID=A0A4Y7RHZ1_9FIRM|nr:Branched-chain-amino-acid aminotransferase 2 [Pelotomaculum schinkii]